jgi:hypothetical protein
MKRDFKWWALCCFHNWVVHPVLPVADVFDTWRGPNVFSQFIYHIHDISYPTGGG